MSQRRSSDTDRLFLAIREWIDHHFPHVPRWRLIGDDPGRPGESQAVLLTVPPAPRGPPGISDDTGDFFSPGEFQVAILTALEGKALRTDALAAATKEDRTKLFRKGGLKELQEAGLVKHHESYGYYRPDAPPAALS
jgi:hypothetical protein